MSTPKPANVKKIVLLRVDPNGPHPSSYDAYAYVTLFDDKNEEIAGGMKTPYSEKKADIRIFVEGWESDKSVEIEYVLRSTNPDQERKVEKDQWFS